MKTRNLFAGWGFAAWIFGGLLSGQTEVHRLTASDSAPGDQLGASVVVNAQFALVGAREDRPPGANLGAVYVFDPDSGAEIDKLVAGDAAVNDLFGESVAMVGTLALVGAPNDDDHGANSGSAYVFDLSDGSEVTKLNPDDGAAFSYFGNAVACNERYSLVAAREDSEAGDAAGAVYVFNSATWEQEWKLTAIGAVAFDTFGYSVAVAGDLALVGAPFAKGTKGAAYVFDLKSGLEQRELFPGELDTLDTFGTAVAVGPGIGVIGAPLDDDGGENAGAAYVIDLANGDVLHKLTADDPAAFAFLGSAVAVYGDHALVGARGEGAGGAAYLFDLETGAEVFKLVPGGAVTGGEFGFSVALHGDTMLMGAHQADELTGAAYVFSRKPIVLGPLTTEGVTIRFAGTLESSQDLGVWVEMSPQPTSPFNFQASSSPLFIRARSAPPP